MRQVPGSEVLAAFGLAGSRPEPVAGGQGRVWQGGSVILKPVDNQAEAEWVAEPFLAEREDHWSVAERLSWAGELPSNPVLRAPAEGLAGQLRPTGRASQLIHGDLSGNVLFADPAPPGIIDFTPYWRPASFGLAVVVADAVAWHGAGQGLLEDYRLLEPVESRSMLARAALFRLITAERLAAAHPQPLAYLHSNAEAYSGVCTVLGVC